LGVREVAHTFIVFIFVLCNLDGDQFCSHNGMCVVLARGVYIGGGGRRGMDDCSPQSRLDLFKESVCVYPSLGVV
jgi:hypothetical protein